MYYIYTKHLDPHHWEWYWTQWTHWNIWYSRSNESPFQEEYDRGCGGVVSLPNTLALEWGAGNLSSGGGSFFTCTHLASLDLGQGQMPDGLMTSQIQTLVRFPKPHCQWPLWLTHYTLNSVYQASSTDCKLDICMKMIMLTKSSQMKHHG